MRKFDSFLRFSEVELAIVPTKGYERLEGLQISCQPNDIDVAVAVEIARCRPDVLKESNGEINMRHLSEGTVPFRLHERKAPRVEVEVDEIAVSSGRYER